MIKVVQGNLFQSKETYLCHQCNCVTNRSKHLAKSVFTRFPYADIYSLRGEHSQPGTIEIRGDGKSQRFVIGMLGQYYPGRSKYPNASRDGTQARLTYFKDCLEKMESLEGSFAFPWRIGCGAAGGDWEEYLDAIKEFEATIKGDVTIYKLEPDKPEPMRNLFSS